MNNIKKLSIATLALFSALAATAGGASAGGGKHHFHHKFHRHHGFHVVIGGGGGGHGCGVYRDMWEDTGSFKWKRRYYMCKGWW